MDSRIAHRYLIAFGSNMRVAGIGGPRAVIAQAVEALEELDVLFHAMSPLVDSAPVGPSLRRYTNGVAVIESDRPPNAMLAMLHTVENRFGRKRQGQAWRARSLDLDIILWDGGSYCSENLVLPHPRFRDRDFVLGPAAAIAPRWIDPISGFSMAQLHARLTRPRALLSARRSQA